METVDVLREDRDDFSGALEVDERAMARVGLRAPVHIPGFQFVIPVFDGRALGREKVVVVDGPTPRPDAARSAEIGDAARSRDTGAGDDDDRARRAQQAGERRSGHGSLIYHRPPISLTMAVEEAA